MNNYQGSAGAKFILMGEHFIVHGGVPALAFPVMTMNTRVSLSILTAQEAMRSSDATDPRLVCQAFVASTDGHRHAMPVVARAMEKAVSLALDILQYDELSQAGGLRVCSESNFPVSRGFGSSASFALSLVRALSQCKEISTERQTEVVHALEQLFHGNPSGIDAAAILAEQPIRFESGKICSYLQNRAADFVLVDGGSRDACKNLVSAIAKRRQADPVYWQGLAKRMTYLVGEAEKALAEGQTKILAELVDENHRILAELELSNTRIDEILSTARSVGALSGKVSGAGAGGAVVIVAAPTTGDRVGAALKERGIDVLGVQRAHL